MAPIKKVLQAVAPLTHAEGLPDLTEQRRVMRLEACSAMVMSQVLPQNYQLSVQREANYSVLSAYRTRTKRNKMLVKFKQRQLNSQDVYQMR
jgi:hypothetical protein